MTTKNYFFTKVFDEGDKAKPLYSNYNFNTYSPQKVFFLEKLSIISQFKPYIKSFLINRNISDRDKFDYITHYKASMTYNEYIKYNTMVEENENNIIHTCYIIGCLNFALVAFFLIKKSPHQPITKEAFLSTLFSLASGYAYYRYSKISYKKYLGELYTDLERRLNMYPDMKMSSINTNYVTEFNYVDEMDDQF